jgi:uncharacterized protein (TIGR00299 family) protein
MKIAYFDCCCGVSGDMILGALIDTGLDRDRLNAELKKLNLSGYRLKTRQDKRSGISGTRVLVEVDKKGPERNLDTIISLIESSDLPSSVKDQSINIFRRLAEVEAGIHGVSVSKIHFHEVGAVDSIVDIVGAAVGFHLLGVDKIMFSPVQVGTSFVECSHGKLPLPAPATAKLLEGFKSFSTGIRHELSTPTGVAILTTLGTQSPQPLMKVESIGYGLGSRNIKEIPNTLRVFVGNTESGMESSTLVIETDIDDMLPETMGNIMERLFRTGALDVNFAPIYMKKNRPGTRITVIAQKACRDQIITLLLEETTTFGVRYYETGRVALERRFETLKTPLGPVKIKVGLYNGKVIKKSPEYEDCRKISEEKQIPLIQVYREVNKLL